MDMKEKRVYRKYIVHLIIFLAPYE